MPANIAPTSYGSSPDNSAVTVDIYGTPPKTPTNNLPGLPDTRALGQIGGSNSMAKGLLKNLSKNYLETGRLLNDKDTALRNVSQALGINKGNLQAMGNRALSVVLTGTGFYSTGIGKVVDGIAKATTGNTLDKNILGGYRNLSVMVGGVKKVIKDVKDVDSFTDLSNFIGKMSGDNEFIKALNLTEIAGVVKGVNDLARDLELPGVYDKLISKMSDEDKKLVSALVVSGTTRFTDLSTIDSMLEHLTGSEILNANPNVINIVVSDFSPTAEFPTPSEEAALHLIQRLEKISPHWYQVKAGQADQWIDDLTVFQNFSVFTRDSFLMADRFKQQIACCQDYRSRNIVSLAKSFYPYIGLPETALA